MVCASRPAARLLRTAAPFELPGGYFGTTRPIIRLVVDLIIRLVVYYQPKADNPADNPAVSFVVIHGHAVQDRRANELPAETQTLRGHNSAPHATQTLWPRLNRSSQRGEHICMKIPTFFAPLLLLAPIIVRFLLRCSSRSMSATYHNPSSR